MYMLPILINGNYEKIAGEVVFLPQLEAIYARSNHLVLNPIIREQADGTQEIVAFGIHPAPIEEEPVKKRRKKRAEVKGDLV